MNSLGSCGWNRWTTLRLLALCAALIGCDRHVAKPIDSHYAPSGPVNTNGSAAVAATVAASPTTTPSASSAPAVAATPDAGPEPPPMLKVALGLQALRDCLRGVGELRPAPKPLYRGQTLRALAAQLGLHAKPGEPAQEAFCEPEVWPEHCGYTDCSSVAGAALIWKRDKRSDNLDSVFVIEEVGGAAMAWPLSNLYLNEPEFACGCMGGDEFSKVSQPTPDTLVAEYVGAIRPGRICSTTYTKSTWLLDARRHPVVVIVEDGFGSQQPSQVVVTRTPNELRIRNGAQCEAVADWAEVASAPPNPPECLEFCRGKDGKRRCCQSDRR